MTQAMRKLGGVLFAAVSALAITASATTASAESLRDNWCKDVHLRFFAGGAEGDAFASIVYNGALQAAKDTGAQVDYVFSGWKAEMMVQQLREAIAAKPDGIAMMGHPGEASIMPLAEEASKAGIKMMYQNVPLPGVVAKFGGGYVGAQQGPQGKALRSIRNPSAMSAKAPRLTHSKRPASRSRAFPLRPSGPPIRTSPFRR